MCSISPKSLDKRHSTCKRHLDVAYFHRRASVNIQRMLRSMQCSSIVVISSRHEGWHDRHRGVAVRCAWSDGRNGATAQEISSSARLCYTLEMGCAILPSVSPPRRSVLIVHSNPLMPRTQRDEMLTSGALNAPRSVHMDPRRH